MIKDRIKKSFLVISPPPFGGKHSTFIRSAFFIIKINNSIFYFMYLFDILKKKYIK